jgi:alkyl sulfatase BDS1-like metallo-beta-lactamase superfamily hydrolase
MTRAQLRDVVAAGAPFSQAFEQGLLPCSGDASALKSLFATFDEFPSNFNILVP